jgi:hypothetical protein
MTAPLPPKMESLALALATGSTVAHWCQSSGVPTRTAYGWAMKAEFKARVLEIRGAIVQAVVGRLTALTTKAADRLDGLLDSESETIRIQAIRATFGCLVDIQTHVELNERVAEIERRLGGRTDGQFEVPA